MAMRVVPPGTFPRQDRLRDFFDQQRLDEELNIQRENPDNWRGSPGRFARPLVPIPDPENVEGLRSTKPQPISDRSEEAPIIEIPKFDGKAPSGYWGNDPSWKELSPYQKAAAMALLEADASGGKPDFASARNVLGAMINRADKEGQDLGDHVSRKIYQPTIEPAQYRRLQNIIRLPEFQALEKLAEARDTGKVGDWVDGSTHFLAHEQTMEGLRAEEPGKYKSWVGWSGYNKGQGRYTNPDGSKPLRDKSHAFLYPEGKHSAYRGPLSDRDDTSMTTMDIDRALSPRPGFEKEPPAKTETAAADTSFKLPKLSEVVFGVDKPVLGNLLGLKLGSGVGAGAGRALAAEEPAERASLNALGLPMATGEDQDVRVFGVASPQRRQPPPLLQLPTAQRRRY